MNAPDSASSVIDHAVDEQKDLRGPGMRFVVLTQIMLLPELTDTLQALKHAFAAQLKRLAYAPHPKTA